MTIWGAIYTRTLGTLSQAVLKLLSIPLEPSGDIQRARLVAVFVQRRFIPDMDTLAERVAMQSRSNIVNIVLDLVCMIEEEQVRGWGSALISTWYKESSSWKACLEMTIQNYVGPFTIVPLSWLKSSHRCPTVTGPPFYPGSPLSSRCCQMSLASRS